MSRQRQNNSAAAITAAALNHLQQPNPPQPPQPHPVVDVDDEMSGNTHGAPDLPGTSGLSNTTSGASGTASALMSGLNLTGQGIPFEKVAIKPREIVCDSLPIEMITKKGIILQYLNSNSAGATTMIGVTRIGLKDPRRMPAYVERNLSIIRQHAVTALHRHFKMTLCSTGALESLTAEDYSVSFSWASVSPVGRSLTLHGKPDLALGYAMCEQFVAPLWASRDDPEPTYVLNVFIQLQEPNRRSSTILRKVKEEEVNRSTPSPAKKYNNGNGNVNYNSAIRGKKQNEELAHLIAQENKVVLEECLKRSAPASFDATYPALPASAGPSWNTSGTTPLPDV